MELLGYWACTNGIPGATAADAYFGERDRYTHWFLTGVGFLLRAVMIRQLDGEFAYRLAPQLEVVRTVE